MQIGVLVENREERRFIYFICISSNTLLNSLWIWRGSCNRVPEARAGVLYLSIPFSLSLSLFLMPLMPIAFSYNLLIRRFCDGHLFSFCSMLWNDVYKSMVYQMNIIFLSFIHTPYVFNCCAMLLMLLGLFIRYMIHSCLYRLLQSTISIVSASFPNFPNELKTKKKNEQSNNTKYYILDICD